MPTLVVTEVVYLLGTRLGVDAEVRFLGDFAAGNLITEPVAAPDWMRIAQPGVEARLLRMDQSVPPPEPARESVSATMTWAAQPTSAPDDLVLMT